MSDISLSEPAATDVLVGQIADEFLERLERGEDPRVEEYAAQHPQLAAILRQVLPALKVMRSPLLRSTMSRTPSPGALGDAGEGMAPCGGQLGDYRILREVGRGGMGIVYEAEQVSLGRRVALKVLPFAAAVEPRQLQRFKQEAQAAAHLLHQNIVAVYAVGCERGVHYYAMQFVDGQSLAAAIAEMRERSTPSEAAADADTESAPQGRLSTERSTRSPSFFRSVAQLGIQAAEALEHAHEQGVLHRDVKPANLLMDGDGHLWVTDFGLARFHREACLTQTGDFVGTLRYVSPEQALGPNALVDQRTDVYGLGATLYELITLQPVHCGQTRDELLRQLERDDAIPMRRLSPNVPIELETIIHKAIAHDPSHRYSSAQDFADDLRRYLEDKPIRARRPTATQRIAKWRRRHPGVVRAAAILFVLGMAALSVGTVLIWREKEHAQKAQAQAEVERRRAEVRHRLARLAPDDVYTDVIQNWLIETDVMRKWLTTEAYRNVERELLNKALAYYQEQAATAARDPEMRLEVAIAHRRIGEVLQKLDRTDDARTPLQYAVTIFETLSREFPEVPDYGLNLIAGHTQIARLLAADVSHFPEAERAYQKALELSLQLVARFPDLADVRIAEAEASGGLGELLRGARRFNEAEANDNRAIDILRDLAAKFPSKADYQSRLARALHNLARLRIDQRDLPAAAKLLQDALQHQSQAIALHRNYPDYRQALTEHFQQLFPVLFQLGNHDEAAKGAELIARILPERACDVSAAVQVLNVCIDLVERETHRPDAERKTIRDRYVNRARELHQEAVRRSEGDADLQCLLAWQFAMLPYEWIHDPAHGVSLAQKAIDLKPAEPRFWTTLGIARYRAGDSLGAIQALTEATRLGNGGTPRDWLYLALAYQKTGQQEEARKWYERAAKDERKDAAGDWELRDLREEAATALAKNGKSGS